MCCLTTGKLQINLLGLLAEQPPFKRKIKTHRRQMRQHPNVTRELKLELNEGLEIRIRNLLFHKC